jgi:hypothetical protein
MAQTPDAPWIRDAEINGFGEPDPVECPVCGSECDTIYMDRDGDVFGCENCIIKTDAWFWAEEQKEADRDDT